VNNEEQERQDRLDWGKHQLLVLDKLGRLERAYEKNEEKIINLEKELSAMTGMSEMLHEIRDELKTIREQQIWQRFKTSAIGALSGTVPVFIYLLWELLSKKP
jgi:hypothetical protein